MSEDVMNDGQDHRPEIAGSSPAGKMTKQSGSFGGGPKKSAIRKSSNRRIFLRTVVLGGVVVSISLLGLIPVIRKSKLRLRLPGALEEHDFLASCIKCGQCVQVCPVLAVKLEDIDSGYGIGTPYIDAREQACDFSCDAAQCILACPTGALTYDKPATVATRPGMKMSRLPLLKAKANDPEPALNLKERMGVAVLEQADSCLAVSGNGFSGQARGPAFKGKMRYIQHDRWTPIPIRDHPYNVDLCDLCVTECPISDAIRLKELPLGEDGKKRARPVVLEQCVGCGVCEMICPVEPAAIVVKARQEWKEA